MLDSKDNTKRADRSVANISEDWRRKSPRRSKVREFVVEERARSSKKENDPKVDSVMKGQVELGPRERLLAQDACTPREEVCSEVGE